MDTFLSRRPVLSKLMTEGGRRCKISRWPYPGGPQGIVHIRYSFRKRRVSSFRLCLHENEVHCSPEVSKTPAKENGGEIG